MKHLRDRYCLLPIYGLLFPEFHRFTGYDKSDLAIVPLIYITGYMGDTIGK